MSLQQALNQSLLQPSLPGDGQLAACSSQPLTGRGGEAGEEEEQGRREQRREGEGGGVGHQGVQWCS